MTKERLEKSYIENERAMLRLLYKNEVATFHHMINFCKGAYSLLHTALYKGIYDSFGQYLRGEHVASNLRFDRGIGKSVTIADYMGNLELRINIEAMFLASNKLRTLYKKDMNTLSNMEEACNQAGKEAVSFLNHINIKAQDFNATRVSICNCQSLVKKFNKELILGNIPRKKYIGIKKNTEEIEKLIIAEHIKIKNVLEYFSFDKNGKRECFEALYLGYYHTNSVVKNEINLSYFLFEKYPEKLENDELKCLLMLYTNANKTLVDLYKNDVTLNDIKSALYKSGTQVRHQVVINNQILPEMFEGYFLCAAHNMQNSLKNNLNYPDVFLSGKYKKQKNKSKSEQKNKEAVQREQIIQIK